MCDPDINDADEAKLEVMARGGTRSLIDALAKTFKEMTCQDCLEGDPSHEDLIETMGLGVIMAVLEILENECGCSFEGVDAAVANMRRENASR